MLSILRGLPKILYIYLLLLLIYHISVILSEINIIRLFGNKYLFLISLKKRFNKKILI